MQKTAQLGCCVLREKDSQPSIARGGRRTPAAESEDAPPAPNSENTTTTVVDQRQVDEDLTIAATEGGATGSSTTSPKSPDIVLSDREKAFIKELRSNTASKPAAASAEEKRVRKYFGICFSGCADCIPLVHIAQF